MADAEPDDAPAVVHRILHPIDLGGTTAYVRVLSPADIRRLAAWQTRTKATGPAVDYEIVAAALCDEAGDRMFSPAEVADLPAAAVDRVAAEVYRRNDMAAAQPAPAAPQHGAECRRTVTPSVAPRSS